MTRWSIREQSRDKVRDVALGDKLYKATLHTVAGRARQVSEHADWEAMRDEAAAVRRRALDRHEALLERFTEQLRKRGVQVHVADTGAEAAALITRLAMEAGGKVTKAKSMTSEEVGLNVALEEAGAQVTETDLGELIVQLAHEPPSHVTAPAIHLSVEDIARIFRDKLGMSVPDWVDGVVPVDEATRQDFARELSLEARAQLRARFLEADVGISGANFLVADSGTIVLVENEGNIQLTTCLPGRHVVLAGLDKLVEREDDLPVLLRMLPVSATGQRQSCYVSLFADRHPDMHVVLLDNGRRALMQDDSLRDLLTCIRCGACMNVCPVYRNIGGHAYGGAYPGPIGALLLPQLFGADRYGELPFASSLCGACSDACPVKIPLHEHLLQLRSRGASEQLSGALRFGLRAGSTVMGSGRRMGAVGRLYRFGRPLATLVGPGRAWAQGRELPAAPSQTFRSWWRQHRAEGSQPRAEAEPIADTSARHQPTEPVAEPTAAPDSVSSLELLAERFAALGPAGETALHHFDTDRAAMVFLRSEIAKVSPDELLVEGMAATKRDYALGITSAVRVLADTGGILLDRDSRRDNWPSLLVDTHVVVAHTSTVIDTLEQGLSDRIEQRANGTWGGYQVFVTGPSRTADVEKVLVIPAHGPRRLVLVLCDEPVTLTGLGAG